MHLKHLHSEDKSVSALPLFKGEGSLLSLRIDKGAELKEHISKVPACLICVQGEALYDDENGNHIQLLPGDYVMIEPHVKHRVNAVETCLLLLSK